MPPGRITARLLVVGMLLLSVSGAGLAETSMPEDPGLARLRTYLEGVEILQADFRQEVFDRDLKLVEEASGQVILKKPGRFRWDYKNPYERVVVADGERIWLYEADLQQVTIRRLDAGLSETPAALLTGDTRVLEQFEFLGSKSDAGIEWMRLKPVSPESDFNGIRLGFVGDRLVQIILDDRLGQQTRIFLTNIVQPVAMDDDVFRFVVPPGVDVIGESEL
jgi:outer membrane lipoprotein carrier protein